MHQKESNHPEAVAVTRPAGPGQPYWRALLETRWRARLREVTELSLAYHAAAAAPGGRGGAGQEARQLLLRTIAVRRRLADVEDALARLAAGTFGRCEQCAAAIPAELLAVFPERRYCPRCLAVSAPAPTLAGGA